MRETVITCLLLILPLTLAAAETVYVDDRVLVGMHQNEDIDSAIIKSIPSGTTLEVVQRGRAMSLVRDQDNVRGWVDNRYLSEEPPAQIALDLAREEIKKLESELETTSTRLADYEKYNVDNSNTERVVALNKENEELKKLLKSERVRVGQLQSQTDELRKSLNKNSKTAGLMKQIDELTEKNKGLMEDIEELNETIVKNKSSRAEPGSGFSLQVLLLWIILALLLGTGLGLYLMDLKIRRRHGGFRV
ncbi:MAG TPA: TIGR04211 family SH3 domain-containing protein [Gammaproteobacteria bacterium]